MNSSPIVFLLLFILFMIASCSSIYLPNSQNVPLFEKARDFQADGQCQVYVPSFTLSFQGQAAYAITNNIGAIANYGIMQTYKNGKAQLGEFGLGYYTHKGTDNYSVFLGSGISSASEFTGFYETTYVNTNYKSVFLQPAYGFIGSRSSFSISTKVILVDSEDTYYSTGFTPLTRDAVSWHFEPAFTATVRLGRGPFYFAGQGGLHFTNYDDASYLRNFARVAIGVQWKLGKNVNDNR